MATKFYQLFIDTGGTFTDCIGIDQDGNTYRRKILSSSNLRGQIKKIISPNQLLINESWELKRDILKDFSFRLLGKNYSNQKVVSFNPDNNILQLNQPLAYSKLEVQNFEITSFEEAPVLGARLITHTALDEVFPNLILKLGSTKGTNALLEHKGSKTLLLITKGFKDLLKIGNQSRPDIFAMNVIKRKQLTETILEVDERIDAKGQIIKSIDIASLTKQLKKLKPGQVESVAIAFMNSYLNPVHEEAAKILVEKLGFRYLSVSAKLTPLIKLLPRMETTVVNAYLSPIINNYVDNIQKNIGNHSFQIMTSNGGLVNASNFHPKDSLLSGPAGGVVGASIVGQQTGYSNLITFDMGGTSTDVSRYSHDFDYRYELEVGDSVINSSAIAIETVAAGGGSICGFDGYKLFVGPESAGAYPGPACYGAGGPLTITDVNLLLGRLDPQRFGIPVFYTDAEIKIKQLIFEIEEQTGKKRSKKLVLKGFIDIANEIMANAIRKISLSKGYAPKDFALVAFGGAGGLHACDIAEMLGINTIILPKDAGLLSAFGIGNARIERFAEKLVLKPLHKTTPYLASLFANIEKAAVNELISEGFVTEQIEIRQRMLFLRFEGQDSCIMISYSQHTEIERLFHEQYQKLFGHQIDNRQIEIETIRVIASVKTDIEKRVKVPIRKYTPLPSVNLSVPVYIREKLLPGATIIGEALFLDNYATTYLKSGWKITLDKNGTALLKKTKTIKNNVAIQTQETELELFANRFMAIAENMGALLQRTALSINIKERLDFSCALLDAEGKLVANAPHIPVHLGGLSVCVKELLKHFTFEEGDTLVTNHPKYGGSHLPDITMVTPVFDHGKRIAFVVNRAHHSEIGGISPGSMPPNAANLEEEGVVIAPFYLMKNGKINWERMRDILIHATYPTRAVEENLADLNAALAANKNGQDALLNLTKLHGLTSVVHYFDLLKQHASNKIIDTLRRFPNGTYSAIEYLDDGSPLKATIIIENGHCTIDYSGSAPVHRGNMNATPAIVHSVTIYVLRLLLNEPIPLNDGMLDPVTLIIPRGLLNPEFDNNPAQCPAVVGGNVEISMRLTDTLLKAFGVVAASQGTMNNILFGNAKFGYYETICGGCGAGEGFHGASAVHHHMTNTRITDPEIMEHRYPVSIDEFSIRKDSGGKGKWNGGDGVIRKITFLEPVNLSVLTQRRYSSPYGLKGGSNGQAGQQKIIRKNGEEIQLEPIQNIDLYEGDQFIIETPGGGGYK